MGRTARLLGALLTFAVTVLASHTTQACEFLFPEGHWLDEVEEEYDHTPPGPVSAITVMIKRGFPLGPSAVFISSCGIRGWLELHLEAPTDNRTPPEQMGYEIAVIAGSAPQGLIPSRAVRARDGTVPLHWLDDGQEPLEFTLSIVSIDLAGQRGPANVVEVRDPGSVP
jgi:hypothetical protein